MGFDDFFAQHYDEVVRALALAVGDRGRAEDAAQEAFAKAYRRWPTVSAMDRPVGWVIVVGTNQLRRWIARTERRFVAVADPVPSGVAHGTGPTTVGSAGPGADPAGAASASATLRAGLAALPPRQRAAVVLRHLCDLPTAEVAEALGCAEGTVKSSLHAGLAALRVELDDPDDTADRTTGAGTRHEEVDDARR